MPRLFADIGPLRRYPEFRRLWLGFATSTLGTQLAAVTLGYEVYILTHSSLDVGLISLVQLVPAIFGSLLGGSIADAIDRRHVLYVTEVAMMACAVGMALDSRSRHPLLWPLFVLSGVNALFAGCDGPTRTAMLTSLVPRESIVAANALRLSINQLATVIGPSIGGILIAALGPATAFFINGGSFLFALATVLSVSSRRPEGGGRKFGLRSIVEGFRFVKERPAIQGCFIADLNATILGMPTALFPAIGLTLFHGGARDVGFLYSAPGLGALLASVLSGWTGSIRRPGLAVCVCITLWGVSIAAFGLSHFLPLALFFLAIAGGADVISAVFRSTIIQTEAPDQLRGRLSSFQTAVVGAGPRLGNFEAGGVAALAGTQFSVVSGGIGCVVGIAIIARLLPRFLRYELPRAEESTLTQTTG